VIRDTPGTPRSDSPTVDDLVEALNTLVRKGATRQEILNRIGQDFLRRMQCIQGSHEINHLLDLADNFVRVLISACRRVEPKTRADAARALFGLYPGTDDKSAQRRETRAAELMHTSYENFRRYLRKALITSVAQEIDRQEFRHIQIQRRAGTESLVYPEGYAVVRTASSYTISPDDYRLHYCTRRAEIAAVRPHVTQFNHYYQWSGVGQEDPPEILSADHKLIGDPVRSENWKYCYIHLGRQLEVGEAVTVELRQRFYDEGKRFSTHLGYTTPNEDIQSVALQVILPLERLPSKIEYVTYADPSPAAGRLDSEPGYCDPASGTIEWMPNGVSYPRRYVIRWDYPNGSLYPDGYELGR
jgi:hypothetical protein